MFNNLLPSSHSKNIGQDKMPVSLRNALVVAFLHKFNTFATQ